MAELLPGVPLQFFRLRFSDQDGPFPFPYIPAKLAFPEIIQDKHTLTTPTAVTKTAASIKDLNIKDQELKQLHLSKVLFRNLVAYADPTRPLPDTDFEYSTLDLTADGKSEASEDALAKAVHSMHLEAAAMQSRTCLANSQNHSQVYIISSMYPIANLAVKQRYNLNLPDGNPLPSSDIPHWRGNVMRADALHIFDVDENPAGLADGILDCGVNKDSNAVLHCKPDWTYTNASLEKIFVNGALRDDEGNGGYNWDLDTREGRLIRQFWGSMVVMGCHFGIWSNGSKVFFAVRLADQRRLVCTPPREWTHPDTVRAVVGLTYAAIDANNWEKNHEINLAEKLAGPETTPA
ncbi:hypothetical protein D9613_008262 [Agrocybe pediades]|uniref:Uncharacterized protein n=1 Tax=Agrocybe pediades TaxID=84607 RepID=A0A8H4QTD8_9AGAR|nr:hypothetical protein D9613_008262 [Agrocybe pediades]